MLTGKQRRFIVEYAKDWNATAAAIRAGYSEKSASVSGFKNRRNKEIRAALDEHHNKCMEDVRIAETARRIRIDAEYDQRSRERREALKSRNK